MDAKRKISLILVVTIVISILSACGAKEITNRGKGVQEEQEEPKKLVIAESLEWTGLDPYQLEWVGAAQTAISEGFLTMDYETKELVPNTAVEFELLDDEKTIKLTIPEGLSYGNGEPVLPEDIKRSIEWGLEMSPYNWDYLVIQDIEIDGNDVFIKSKDFSATVMYYLTNNFMPIMSKKQIENLTSEELLTKAVPYGMFYIDEFVSGSYVSLKRNEYYKTNNPNVENRGPSPISELTVKFMPDAFSRLTGLVSGEIDIVFGIPVENAHELENNPDIEVYKFAEPGLNYLTLNMDNPLFEDINVRKAIAYAIDREAIAKANNYYVKPAFSFIVPEMMDYSDEVAEYYENTYANDIQKAKKLLIDAGWSDTNEDGYIDKDGNIFEFSLIAPSESFHSKMTIQLIQAQLKELGIKINIETLEKNYIKEKMSNDEYDAVFKGFYWAEPISILPYIILDSNNIENEKYFDIISTCSTIRDKDERISKLAEAQKLLMDEVTIIPILQEYCVLAYRNNITGIKILADGTFYFNDIDKK